jgi:CheY-like chemotaxis protein
MSDAGASFQAQLAAMSRQFAEQLPGRLAEMQALLAKLQQEVDPERLETLHRMAHSLAGSAGSFGLPEVGKAARQLETCLKPVAHGEQALPDRHLDIWHLLEQLADAVAGRAATAAFVPGTVAPETRAPDISLASPSRILVVDDDAFSRQLLTTLLEGDGHEVISAADGEAGVARFTETQPDLVFMDVMMPVMDGYEAASRIKQACGNQFVPLIFLTALQAEEDLARCIASGGDDFIVKPYNRLLLRAKLLAMQRIRDLHRELARYQQQTAEEIELARHAFDAVTQRNPKLASIHFWQRPVGQFSGDLLLYGLSPTGRLLLLFGDFTGHGLSAAIAAVPVADLFYGLVEDEVSLPDLTLAINRKLRDILPAGHFCAALMIDFDPARQHLEIWNGGIPAVYVLDGEGRIRHRCPSSKLPLGIIGDRGFDPRPERVDYAAGDALLCFSDGVNETCNHRGEMLGIGGAEHLFPGPSSQLLNRLINGLAEFMAGTEQTDDVSILSLDLSPLQRTLHASNP